MSHPRVPCLEAEGLFDLSLGCPRRKKDEGGPR